MEIEINSTWEFRDVEGFKDGIYRVLRIEDNISALIMFNLEHTTKIVRPALLQIEHFRMRFKKKKIQKTIYELSPYLLHDEEIIPVKYKSLREERYKKIKELVQDPDLLFDFSTKRKIPEVSIQAIKCGTDNKTIYRLLNLYWRLGQTKNSLLPAYSLSGGKGKIREAVKNSLGTKPVSRTGQFCSHQSYIVKEKDRELFEKALKKYYLKPNGLNLKETYKNLLRQSYQFEILDAYYLDTIPGVPSYRQFINWSKKIFDQHEIVKFRTSETDYLRNKRAVEASITDRTPLPGSCFEIDATVADVHIVSELRRNHVIGRPTIYSIIDRASRMIVGFHVSLYHASWKAARQALVNAFSSKIEYCQQFGIEISEDDWPCSHLPQRLICDNGEMIGLKPQELIVPLTELQIAPPYRPDCKSLVERRFGYLNDKSLHRLLGSSRGGKIIRGSPDPRKSAIYTLREITTLLIRDVIEHNKEIFDDLALTSHLLIENDLTPTPINYWNVHLSNYRHALKKAGVDEINARLLPREEVSMTRSGVLFNEMYYSCQRVRDENLAAIARNHGRFKLEARVNYDDTSYIYVRLKDNEGFTRCDILERSKEFKGMPLAEVYYLQDWLDDKKRKQLITTSSIDNLTHKENLQQSAIKSAKQAPKLKTKSERTKNVKQRRRDEIELIETQAQQELSSPESLKDSSKVEGRSFSNQVTKLPRRKNKGQL
ncbi:DDE-type integrase/transposase/recombinase [Vibrio parahaemolyticus]|uniref:DDE-type integrase/transposase/recombinase n=1 Tax=Vibrio parahaemolyticus TaxID=670 RepID=UPI000417F68A|nr:DDE-type integrase/transposase/recombinase [Vibrio parahaemolyticus]